MERGRPELRAVAAKVTLDLRRLRTLTRRRLVRSSVR